MPVRTGKRRIVLVLEAIIMFCWTASVCARTDSYEVVYLLCGVLAFCGLVKRGYAQEEALSGRDRLWLWLLSSLMSLAVTCANYKLYTAETWVVSILLRTATLAAGVLVFWNLLTWCWGVFSQFTWPERTEKATRPVLVFFVSAALLVLVDLAYLFLVQYPGVLTPDSNWQLEHSLSVITSNYQPFWHTILIRFWVTVGLRLFGDLNSAVALYSVFQLMSMAVCFSWGLVTLYELRLPKACVGVYFLWVLLMPYNISYSVTMWKDILFGGVVLVFLVSLFRICKGVGKSVFLNYAMLTMGALGSGLLRNNGWLAMLAAAIVFIALFWRRRRTVCIVLLAVVVASYVMKGPALRWMGVSPSPITESLSIPIQQVARVVANGKPITDAQRELINQVIDADAVPTLYNPSLSDPVKFSISASYLIEHKWEYLKLWLSLGVRYPMDYIQAWIDQTRGYWNGGYEYWIMSTNVYNDGIEALFKTIRSEAAAEWFNGYCRRFETSQVLRLFVSIGLTDWLVFLLGAFNLRRGDREKAFLSVPVAMIIGTLLVATPVFAEFRYAYAAFTCLPFLLFMTFARDPNAGTGGMWSEIRASSEERENG